MRVEPRQDKPGQAFIVLPCAGEDRKGRECRFRLDQAGRSINGGIKVWEWDGNVEAPTIQPSIHCLSCGLHTTITAGSASPPIN